MSESFTLELKPAGSPGRLSTSATSATAVTALHAEEWKGAMKASLRTQQNLLDMNVPPREAILGEWFRQGDLSFIYGPRGLGKTWLAPSYLATGVPRRSGRRGPDEGELPCGGSLSTSR